MSVVSCKGYIVVDMSAVRYKDDIVIDMYIVIDRYNGEVGDVVIGRILQVGQRRWKVDIHSRLDAILMLSAVNLPGGELVGHVVVLATKYNLQHVCLYEDY